MCIFELSGAFCKYLAILCSLLLGYICDITLLVKQAAVVNMSPRDRRLPERVQATSERDALIT